QLTSNLSFYDTFQNKISISDCLDPYGGLYLFTHWPAGVCPFLQGFCPIIACTSDNPRTPGCSAACAINYPDKGVCVHKFDTYTYFIASRPNMCEIRLQDTGIVFFNWNASFCASFYNGYFVGNDPIAFRPYGACQINATFNGPNDCYT